MAGLFDYDPNAARSQSLFAALLASAPQLMAAGAPSTQPGSWGRGIGAAGPAFIQAQQGYMNSVQGQALRALQMKKLQEEMAQQEAWRKMLGGMQPQAQSGSTLFDTQGGEMLTPGPADPADGSQGGMFAPQAQASSLFGNMPQEYRALLGQMGPQAGAAHLLKSQYDTPSDIRIAEWYRTATPEQRAAFDKTKRAEQFLKLGDRVIAPNPSDPSNPKAVYPMGLPPQDQPAVRGAQKEAATAGEAKAKRDFNMMGIGEIISSAESYLSGEATGKKPTSSGVGSYVDTAAGFFGKTPEGAQEADALRAIGGALVAKMPRMEGPQSDYDVKSYREMAGQVGDSSIPIERRQAALKEVKRLWAKYDTQGANKSAQPNIDDLLKKYGGQ